MKITLVHYAYTPVIGGVEFVMAQHAALFARHGHEVRVVCGSGVSEHEGVECVVIPDLLPTAEPVHEAQEALTSPEPPERFSQLKASLKPALREALSDADVIIVHNMMTMHFNIAATAALWELAEERTPDARWISWVHDIASVDPDYPEAKGDHYPTNILSRSHPDMSPAVISEKRQRQFCKLADLQPDNCPVVPNGIEFLPLLKLTKDVRRLTRKFGILYRDIVLIHPTRILRRKNIELGIRTLAALKAQGKSCLYLVTGAPDPHNEATREYGEELKALIEELDVGDESAFVSERFKVSDRDLISLYSISDLLFLPSKQEGFGLPLLEAGLFRLPVFCTEIEPMKSVLENNVHPFSLETSPEVIAQKILDTLEASPGFRARKEVMRLYSWDVLFKKKISPILFSPR